MNEKERLCKCFAVVCCFILIHFTLHSIFDASECVCEYAIRKLVEQQPKVQYTYNKSQEDGRTYVFE